MERLTAGIILTEGQYQVANSLVMNPGGCALCLKDLNGSRALLAQPYSSFHKKKQGKMFLGAICPACQAAINETILKLKSGETQASLK